MQIIKPVSKQEHEEDPYVSRNVGAEHSRAQPSTTIYASYRTNNSAQNGKEQKKTIDNKGSRHIRQRHIPSEEHSMLYQLRNIDSIQNIQNKQASQESGQRTLEVYADEQSNDLFKSRSPSSGWRVLKEKAEEDEFQVEHISAGDRSLDDEK